MAANNPINFLLKDLGETNLETHSNVQFDDNSQCSCNECDTIRCFMQKDHTPNEPDISSTCIIYSQKIRLRSTCDTGDKTSERAFMTKKEFEDEGYDELINNKSIPPTRRHSNCIYMYKKHKDVSVNTTISDGFENKTVAEINSEKTIYKPKDLNPGTAKLTAQVMKIPYKDFKESISSDRSDSSSARLYRKSSLKNDIIKKLQKVYEACSCKVCECLNIKTLPGNNCKCEPCACNNCTSIKYCTKCMNVEKNNKKTSVDCQSCFEYESKPCTCKPCNCIECRSLSLPNTLVVSGVDERYQRSSCQCVPCNCAECRLNRLYSLCASLVHKISTGIFKTNSSLCENHIVKICKDGSTVNCNCNTADNSITKTADRNTHDCDIHQVSISQKTNGQQRNQIKLNNHDTIAMFAAVPNSYIHRGINKKTCDCNDCECIVCKQKRSTMRRKDVQSIQKISQFQHNDKSSSCDYTIREREIYTKNRHGRNVRLYHNNNSEHNDDLKKCYEITKPSIDIDYNIIASKRSNNYCNYQLCKYVDYTDTKVSSKNIHECTNGKSKCCIQNNRNFRKKERTLYDSDLNTKQDEQLLNKYYLYNENYHLKNHVSRSTLKDEYLRIDSSPFIYNTIPFQEKSVDQGSISYINSTSIPNKEDSLDITKANYSYVNLKCNAHSEFEEASNKYLVRNRGGEASGSSVSMATYCNESILSKQSSTNKKLPSWGSSCNKSGKDNLDYLVTFPRSTVENCRKDIFKVNLSDKFNLSNISETLSTQIIDSCCFEQRDGNITYKPKEYNENIDIVYNSSHHNSILSLTEKSTKMNNCYSTNWDNIINYKNGKTCLEMDRVSHDRTVMTEFAQNKTSDNVAFLKSNICSLCLKRQIEINDTKPTNCNSIILTKNSEPCFKIERFGYDQTNKTGFDQDKTNANDTFRESNICLKIPIIMQYARKPHNRIENKKDQVHVLKEKSYNSIRLNDTYNRTFHILRKAKAFTEQLSQLLEKYEKANRDFQNISQKLKAIQEINNWHYCIKKSNIHMEALSKEKEKFALNRSTDNIKFYNTMEKLVRTDDFTYNYGSGRNENIGKNKVSEMILIKESNKTNFIKIDKNEENTHINGDVKSELINHYNNEKIYGASEYIDIKKSGKPIFEESNFTHDSGENRRQYDGIRCTDTKCSYIPLKNKKAIHSIDLIDCHKLLYTAPKNTTNSEKRVNEEISAIAPDIDHSKIKTKYLVSKELNNTSQNEGKVNTNMDGSKANISTEISEINFRDAVSQAKVNGTMPWSLFKKNNLSVEVNQRRHKGYGLPALEKEIKEIVQSMSLQINTHDMVANYLYKNKALEKLQSEVKKLLYLPMLQKESPSVEAEHTTDNDEKSAKLYLKNKLERNKVCSSSQTYHKITTKVDKELNTCDSMLDISSYDPLKVRFLRVRKISDHTVLVKWDTPQTITNVQGYELQVDGRAIQQIFSPSRRMAVVTCLPHAGKVLLTIRTILSPKLFSTLLPVLYITLASDYDN